MKKLIKASSQLHISQCSFDFDLGTHYDSERLSAQIENILDQFGCYVCAIDFRSVDYSTETYSQCSFDFEWSNDYDQKGISNTIEDLIESEDGEFLGIDFYSLTD